MLNYDGKADLHVHTTASDGTATVVEVLKAVAESDLKVVAITDHDTLDGAKEALRLASYFGVEVIVGEEVSTREGHLLALFVETVLPPGRPAAETIRAVHAQGGLCIAAHPYDWAVPSLGQAGLRQRCRPRASDLERADWPLDAIEAFNASITWPRAARNLLAQYTAKQLGLPAVGGSDSHILATIGRGFTRFRGTSADDLYQAIRSGEVACAGSCMTAAEQIEYCHRWLRYRYFGAGYGAQPVRG